MLWGYSSRAADTVRVCTYNLLKFSQANEDGRLPQFRRILENIRPDVMICQEVIDGTTVPLFISDVLKWGSYGSTPFIDGPDSDHLVFFDQSKFDLVGTRIIPTELRNILEVTLALRPHDNTIADTVVIYSVHLKASDNSSDAAQRGRELNAVISSMTKQRNVIIAGDFNIYGTSEVAYTALTGPTASRKFIDPMGSNWRRNTAEYAYLYTQATRLTNISGCGGGVDGGIDDRFDYIFLSPELAPRIVSNSYTVYGNDGVQRFNKSIDDPVNTKVAADIAQALKCASDHLPVYTDIILGDQEASVTTGAEELPLTASWQAPYLTLRGVQDDVLYSIYTINGKHIANVRSRHSTSRVMLGTLPSGTYVVSGGGTSVRFVVAR
jgi:endonuclease/exonuclease/phosphatase family metal-dependent hydrolase